MCWLGFYEGWNAHDANKMVSVYADDVDHINTYANGTRESRPSKTQSRGFTPGREEQSQDIHNREDTVHQTRCRSGAGPLAKYGGKIWAHTS
jgi:hypothetical protein